MNKKISLVVIIFLILVLVVLYYTKVIPGFGTANAAYQAIFLTNGQVYFGHLAKMGDQYPDLTNVYYLQVTQPPQPIQAGQTPPSNINLVKLGGELHGPTDEMRINRDQILFIETLRPDSGVVKAIEQLQAASTKK